MREMKDSGTNYIGVIPVGWNLQRLRFLSQITTGDMDTQDNDPNGIYPFFVRSPIVEHSNKFSFDNEAVLMAGDGVGAGKVFHYVYGKYACHQRVYSISNLHGVNGKYLFYYMKELFYKRIEESNAKSTVDSVRLPMLKDFLIAFPNLQEQKKIADYLDSKCSQIDAIISKQEQIIEKLKEYKLSVITEAVTKGLNSNVEMKDSGVEWIGEIPKLCEIRKLFWLLKNIGSGTTPKGEHYYLNGNIPWLITSDLNDDAIDKVSKYVTSDALRDYSALHVHKAGSVGIAMYGATIGKLGLIELDVTTNQACCMLFPNQSLNRKMLFYILYAAKGYFIYSSYGSGQPNISQYTIKQLRIPYFNMVYQQRIADYLDSKCSQIDISIEKKEQIIDKLREYKKSLIYEVVTGKREV